MIGPSIVRPVMHINKNVYATVEDRIDVKNENKNIFIFFIFSRAYTLQLQAFKRNVFTYHQPLYRKC